MPLKGQTSCVDSFFHENWTGHGGDTNRVRTMCEKGKRMMKKLVIVIFGASGDLTKRKLMPALYTLYNGGRLPEGFTILGIGRTEYTDARYQEYIMSELGKFRSFQRAGGR